MFASVEHRQNSICELVQKKLLFFLRQRELGILSYPNKLIPKMPTHSCTECNSTFQTEYADDVNYPDRIVYTGNLAFSVKGTCSVM